MCANKYAVEMCSSHMSCICLDLCTVFMDSHRVHTPNQAQTLLKELGVAKRSIGANIAGEGKNGDCEGELSGTRWAGENEGDVDCGDHIGSRVLPDTLDFGEGEIEWLDGDWSPPPRGGRSTGASTGEDVGVAGGVGCGGGGGNVASRDTRLSYGTPHAMPQEIGRWMGQENRHEGEVVGRLV